MTLATLTLAASLALVVRGQSFGPVDLEAVDPLSLSWNQIHWLVRDQIKEVEELKAEHDDKPSPSAAKLETALAKAKKREGELDKRASQFAKFIKDQGLELPAKPAATSRKGRAAKGGQGPAEAGADP